MPLTGTLDQWYTSRYRTKKLGTARIALTPNCLQGRRSTAKLRPQNIASKVGLEPTLTILKTVVLPFNGPPSTKILTGLDSHQDLKGMNLMSATITPPIRVKCFSRDLNS